MGVIHRKQQFQRGGKKETIVDVGVPGRLYPGCVGHIDRILTAAVAHSYGFTGGGRPFEVGRDRYF